jgi:ribosomal-protein-serine acetyltransferase
VQLPVDLGDGDRLILRDLSTIDEVVATVTGDIERIRRYEAWAHDQQSSEAMERFTRFLLTGYRSGSTIPTLITHDDRPVGAVTARIDPARHSAELGYWIEGGHEGRGLVTRCCEILVSELVARGVRRAVIRTAAENERSLAVARRLGFAVEKVRPGAFPVAGVNHDEVSLVRHLVSG